MPCLLVLIAICAPRFAIVLLFLFSDYLGRAYETAVWPLVGFIFMPFTTLAYAVAINEGGGVHDWYLVLVILAVLADLSTHGGSGNAARRRGGG